MSECFLASYCGFPVWLSGKDPPAMQETQEMIQSQTQKDPLEEGMATHSCLENPGDRGAWQTTVHGVSKSQTRLSDEHTHRHVLRAFPT